MMGLIHPMIAACIACGMLAAAPAAAEGGRITFIGAVVVPTCNMTAAVMASTRASIRSRPSYQQNCADHGQVRSSVSTYIVTARRLTHVEPDRVLNYFESYISARQTEAAPILVTRTYE